jgi:hypothetical protein
VRSRGTAGVERQHGLAEGGRVRGERRTDVEVLIAVVRPEDVVDDHDLAFEEAADADHLAAAGGQ